MTLEWFTKLTHQEQLAVIGTGLLLIPLAYMLGAFFIPGLGVQEWDK